MRKNTLVIHLKKSLILASFLYSAVLYPIKSIAETSKDQKRLDALDSVCQYNKLTSQKALGYLSENLTGSEKALADRVQIKIERESERVAWADYDDDIPTIHISALLGLLLEYYLQCRDIETLFHRANFTKDYLEYVAITIQCNRSQKLIYSDTTTMQSPREYAQLTENEIETLKAKIRSDHTDSSRIGLFFVVAHELAHIILGHCKSNRQGATEEMAADGWAISQLEFLGLAPIHAENLMACLKTFEALQKETCANYLHGQRLLRLVTETENFLPTLEKDPVNRARRKAELTIYRKEVADYVKANDAANYTANQFWINYRNLVKTNVANKHSPIDYRYGLLTDNLSEFHPKELINIQISQVSENLRKTTETFSGQNYLAIYGRNIDNSLWEALRYDYLEQPCAIQASEMILRLITGLKTVESMVKITPIVLSKDKAMIKTTLHGSEKMENGSSIWFVLRGQHGLHTLRFYTNKTKIDDDDLNRWKNYFLGLKVSLVDSNQAADRLLKDYR